MTKKILDGLRVGLELNNYGQGWFLMEPSIPYKSMKSWSVKDDDVDRLASDGLIEIKMHSRSMSADIKDKK